VSLDIPATHGIQEVGLEGDPVQSIWGKLGDGEGGVSFGNLFLARAHDLITLKDAVGTNRHRASVWVSKTKVM